MHLAVELGQEIGMPLELGPLVNNTITRFDDNGCRGQEDMLEIIRDFMQRFGIDAYLSGPNGETSQVLRTIGLLKPAQPVRNRKQDNVGEHPNPYVVRQQLRDARNQCFGERAVYQ